MASKVDNSWSVLRCEAGRLAKNGAIKITITLDSSWIIVAALGFPAVIVAFLKRCSSLDEHLPKGLGDLAGKILDDKLSTHLALDYFLSRFDLLFCGAEGIRPKFYRCAVFSIGTFIAIFCAWIIFAAIFEPSRLEAFNKDYFGSSGDWLFPRTTAQNTWLSLAFVFVVNVIGDYFSFWETRYILEKLKSTKLAVSMIALLICDVIASIAIFAASLVVLLFFAALLGGQSEIDSLDWFYEIFLLPILTISNSQIYQFSESGLDVLISVSLYTSLSTTIWASLSVITIRVWSVLRVAKLFPMASRSPFGALSAIVILLICIIVAILDLLT